MPRFCKHLSVCKCWTINSRYIKIHCPSPPTPSSRIIDIWQGSEYLIDSKNVTVLNIRGFSKYQNSKYIRVLSMPGFWIYQGSEDASGSQYTRFLNIPEFWIFWFPNCQCSKYAKFSQGPEYAWIIPEYAWLCLNMLEYEWIFLNLPEWLLIYMCPLSLFIFINDV